MFSVFEELTGLQKCPPRLDPIISIMDEPLDPIMLLFGETPDITPVPWLSIFSHFFCHCGGHQEKEFPPILLKRFR